MTNKPVKKFTDKDLARVLSSINAGRGTTWMRSTLRELVFYVKWLHGRDSTHDVG